MSLILDALNRAEQERSEKNHIPSLQSMHGSTEVVRPSLLQRLHLERWLIVLVVAYLAVDYFSDKPASPMVTPASAPVAAPVEIPGPAPEVVQKPQAEKLVAPAPAPEPVSAARPESTPAVDSKPASRVASSREVESLYSAPATDPEKSRAAGKAEPLVDNTAAPASQTAATEQQRAYARAEEITQLPLDFRQQIPSLKYGNHIPASESADSRVVLNGTVYKEGDQVAPGLVLKGISEQGIVLEFQGTQFRLEAHNSWINFQ
jgi:general secretion pathway protein B